VSDRLTSRATQNPSDIRSLDAAVALIVGRYVHLLWWL